MPGEALLTAASAQDDANLIKDFWENYGYRVRAWVIQVSHGRGELHCVRSDLKRGLPRDFRREDLGRLAKDFHSWKKWTARKEREAAP
jgi:hypothetical protein